MPVYVRIEQLSGYCLTMWVIPTAAVTAAGGNPAAAADPASFRGLLLPTKALHPSAIAIITNEGGKKVTQPLYSRPLHRPPRHAPYPRRG